MSEANGVLALQVKPWAVVAIDGQAIAGHLDARKAIPLGPGAHTVILTHPDFQPFKQIVNIASGKTLNVTIDLRDEAVRRKH
ncbi:MAG TPA: hypothetical protein VLT85_01500 [Terriglobales bacterium]|nr:hypothetical protein [Terriglobales bacterium]